MDRHKELYELRWYEGEHAFACNTCDSTFVEYSFDSPQLAAVLTQHPIPCGPCGAPMLYLGWSGRFDVTESIFKLIEDGHLMAATVMIGAFTELQIDCLLWAVLVDGGLSRAKACEIANGTVPRGDAIRMIRGLLERRVANVVFPIRNEVAHGRAFGRANVEFIPHVEDQLKSIAGWVRSVRGDKLPTGYDYSECDRWILSMNHWSEWTLRKWAEMKQTLASNSTIT